MKVGQVNGIKVVDRNIAEVTFSVDRSQQLLTSTQARIRYRNLVGQRYVSLTEGAGTGAVLRPDATIPLAQTQPALDLTVLFNGFKPLFVALSPQDVNKLSFEIIQTLQGEGGTVYSLLASTASLTNTIADRAAVGGRVVSNMDRVLATIDERDATFSELLVQLQRFVSGLAADRQPILDSLDNISSLAGATAGLLTDIRPSLKADIGHLGAVAGTLASTPDLDRVLYQLPERLNKVVGTATYGSWFDFYLCDFDGKLTLPTGEQVPSPSFHVHVPRCSQ